MAIIDLEKQWLLNMLAGENVDENTPLVDLKRLAYAKNILMFDPNTITVRAGESVQEAVSIATAGIVVKLGVGTFELIEKLIVPSGVTVDGAGAELTILDGDVEIMAGGAISNLSVNGNLAGDNSVYKTACSIRSKPTGDTGGIFTATNVGDGLSSAVQYYVPNETTNFKVLYSWWLNPAVNETLNGGFIRSSVKIGSTVYPLFFNGVRDGRINPYEFLVTDALKGVEIEAGTVVEVRSFAYVEAAGQKIPASGRETYGQGMAVDKFRDDAAHVDASTYSNDSGLTYSFKPVTVCGDVGDKADGVFAIIGDSITGRSMYGTELYAESPWGMAIADKNVGFLPLSFSGGGSSQILQAGVPNVLYGYKKIVCGMGRNVLAPASNLATNKANFVKLWTELAKTGAEIYQVTVTPYCIKVEEGDPWTEANQTEYTANADARMKEINDWLRGEEEGGMPSQIAGIVDWAKYVNIDNGTHEVWGTGTTGDGVHPTHTNPSGLWLLSLGIKESLSQLNVDVPYDGVPVIAFPRLQMSLNDNVIDYSGRCTITPENITFGDAPDGESKVAVFNGTSSRILAAEAGALLNGADKATIGMWVYHNTSPANNRYFIVNKSDSVVNIALVLNNSNSNLVAYFGSTSLPIWNAGEVTPDEWKFIVLKGDMSANPHTLSAKVMGGSYVNESLATAAATLTNDELYLGVDRYGEGYWQCKIGDVVVANRILTEAEIDTFYNLTKGKYEAPE